MEEGPLVIPPAPRAVVDEINAVLNGEVWDYETAFYPTASDSV